MPSEDHISDDYVAKLMTKDAKESTIRYSAFGLQGFLPKRPTTNAPRANTRFLKNIIRETDSHNAALKSKETQEAKRRLNKLQKTESSTSTSFDRVSPRYDRHESTDKHERKRRRLENREDDEHTNRSQSKQTSHRHGDTSRKERSEHRKYSHRHDDHSDSNSESDRRSRHRRKHRSSRTHRSRSRSPHRSSRRDRSDRHRRSRHSVSPASDRDHGYHRSRRKKNRSYSRSPDWASRKKTTSPTAPPEADEVDSDPLEAIVGPAPPPPAPKVQARGRGAFTSSSVMDNHFSSTYDPSADTHPNSDSENDWDQALEALRDRQRWKQQGAERLRSAGFTEDEVKKWEKGGEKTAEDVKWRGIGEGREWDRGKVVYESGIVDTKPEWGRLKGT